MRKTWEFITALWDWYVLRPFFYYFPPRSETPRKDEGQTLDDD